MTKNEKLSKPEGLSDYMWKKYLRIFQQGCEMWTSEDGTLVSLAIIPVENWQKILEVNFSYLWDQEQIDPERVRTEYAYQAWQGREFFNGPYGGKGKVWLTQKEPSPCPVLIYDLKIPR